MKVEFGKDKNITPVCIYFSETNEGECLFRGGTPTLARLEGDRGRVLRMICRGELSVGISRGTYQKDHCNKYALHKSD